MIIVVCSHPIEMIPPVISFIRVVKELGEKVGFVGITYTERSKDVMSELGVAYCFREHWQSVKFAKHPCLRIWFEILRRCGCLHSVFQPTDSRRRFVWKAMRKLSGGLDNQTVIVSTSMITASLLGDGMLPLGKRHVHWALELGDRHGIGFDGFDEKRFFAAATFITSEINRSRIFQEENNTPDLPATLPNKAWGHPRKRNLPIADPRAAGIVATWEGKAVFLYQGSLGVDRDGIVTLLEWLSEEFPNAIVAVMTRFCPSSAKQAFLRHRNIALVPYVTAPHHLEVTSHATIGIAMYVANKVEGLSDQNAIHCAPNKTFECAGFGIPLLCNDIPGLVDSVGVAGAAICVPFARKQMIEAARTLLAEYEKYSVNATRFFDSVDEVVLIRNILGKARCREVI